MTIDALLTEKTTDHRAEASVLTVMLLPDRDEYVDEVLRTLQPDDFHAESHRHVFSVLGDLYNGGRPRDLVTVAGALQDRGLLEAAGGSRYLVELTDLAPYHGEARAHLDRVLELSRARRLLGELRRRQTAILETADLGAWAAETEERIARALEPRDRGDEPETMAELVPAVVAEVQARREAVHAGKPVPGVVPISLQPLAGVLGNWQAGLYVVAGRPGMGKTAIAGRLSRDVAKLGRAVVFVSAEMGKAALTLRALAAESAIPFTTLDKGDMTTLQLGELEHARQSLERLPMAISFAPGATLVDVQRAVTQGMRKLRRRHPGIELGMVVVDFLQLMKSRMRRRDATKAEEVSELARALAEMAGRQRAPVLCLSQLNRGVESRADKRPMVSDLKESGGIEEAAHAVLLLYRDQYYNPSPGGPDKLEVIIGKHRNGPTGTVELEYVGGCMDVEWQDLGSWAEGGL